MLINFNRENMEKLDGNGKVARKGIVGFALFLTLTLLLTGCNKSMFDSKYGFDQALIFGDDSAIILDVKNWKDYSGEQIQLVTNDNFVLLTSSFDTNCIYGDSTSYSSNSMALNGVESDEVYRLTDEEVDAVYNKNILDTKWAFNKAITFNGNKALILPVGKWKDYSGEQLQVITNDGLVLILSSYNSKLVCDSESEITANEFASSYVGSDGEVIDLSGISKDSSFNYDILDTKFDFNKALIVKDEKVLILPISEWCDYEGEQIQIKIVGGPTMVTAAYDTILLKDVDSKTKAVDVANALGKEVVDLASGYTTGSHFNKTILDFNNGFTNVIFSNDNSSSALKIKEWCDYEGEQLQVILENGDVILSSSMMLDLINGGTSSINASSISKSYVSDVGKNIDKSNGDISSSTFNKTVFDFNNKFKYALKVVDGNVTIIPLKKWQDFYNSDGGEYEEDSPNCEQLQLILPDDTCIVTTAYDTILVNSSNIKEVAELFRGENGIISDLTSYVGEPSVGGWNYSFFDTKYKFSCAILNSGECCQVFPIKNWLDFSEGEQLQLNFTDNTGVLTSFVNTTLVDPKTDGIEEVIAKAFSGSLDKDKGLVKVYK